MNPVAEPVAPRPPSESDWEAFVDVYGRAIVEWLRRCAVSPDRTGALARELMEMIGRDFAQIVNEQSVAFRASLRYSAHTAWQRLTESRTEAGGGEAYVRSPAARDDLLQALDAECTHQRRRQALSAVQHQADPADWEVFYFAVLEGVPVSEVAARLPIAESSAREALSRVRHLLNEQLQKLEVPS